MNTAKKRLLKIIEEIPEQEVDKILDFAEYLKAKQEVYKRILTGICEGCRAFLLKLFAPVPL